MANLELADKLQNAAPNHYGDLCGMLWDGGAALRKLHTGNMALRCTEMALKDELEALKRAISDAEPKGWLCERTEFGKVVQRCVAMNPQEPPKDHRDSVEPLYTLKGIK